MEHTATLSPQAPLPLAGRRLVLAILLVAAGYFALALFGLRFVTVDGTVSPLWPAIGFGLAMLLILDLRVAIGIALGGFLEYLFLTGSLAAALLACIGQAGAPLLGAVALRQRVRDTRDLVCTGRGVMLLIGVGGYGSAMASASFGTLALAAGGGVEAAQLWEGWLTWWLGDALGIVAVTPPILAWRYRERLQAGLLRRTELILLSAAILFLAGASFAGVDLGLANRYGQIYLVLPLLIWVAMRFSPAEVTLLNALAIGTAAYGLLAGDPGGEHKDAILAIHGLAAITTLIILVLAAVLTELRRSEAVGRARLAEIGRLNEDLERRVQLRTAALQAANEELEAFGYSVSHDLRAPLRSIDGFSRLLMDDHGPCLEAEGLDYLQRIRAASQRMDRLIDDLLKLSRMGQSEVRRGAVDLSVLAQEVVQELQDAEPERAVRLVLAGDCVVEADPGLARVLMDNLLRNAFKFTRQRSDAVIEFGRDGGEFFVRDNGIGFDMDYAGRLFAPFHRLHSSSQFEGSGIGLAIVQRVVRMHGGEIRAVGRPGAGAAFHFTLG